MKRIIALTAAAAAAAVTLSAGAALAENEATCNVPMNQWQSADALKSALEAQGWQVRRVKTEGGCYDVFAIDTNGNRVQAAFNPKTFEVVGSESEG